MIETVLSAGGRRTETNILGLQDSGEGQSCLTFSFHIQRSAERFIYRPALLPFGLPVGSVCSGDVARATKERVIRRRVGSARGTFKYITGGAEQPGIRIVAADGEVVTPFLIGGAARPGKGRHLAACAGEDADDMRGKATIDAAPTHHVRDADLISAVRGERGVARTGRGVPDVDVFDKGKVSTINPRDLNEWVGAVVSAA